MEIRMNRLSKLVLILTVMLSGPAYSQDTTGTKAKTATEKPAPKQAKATPTDGNKVKASEQTQQTPTASDQKTLPKPIDKFVAARARAEKLRYRHLWLAYAAAWLLIFLFVFRTWKMNQGTTDEIETLKRRLAKLEGPDA